MASITFTNTGGIEATGGFIGNLKGTASLASSANSVAWTGVSDRPTNVSSFTNDSGYITSSDISGKLDKITYEWNKEKNFGSSGKLLIGKFPCYDTNVTVDIDATTNITYHATLVMATQNINDAGGGIISASVFGDANNTIAPNIYIEYKNNSRVISIYFSPSSWSKNLIHIRATALNAAASNICESVDSIPSTAIIKPTNELTNNFLTLSGGTLTGNLTSNGTITASSGFIGNLKGTASLASSANSVAWTGVSDRPTDLSQFNNTGAGYITGITKSTVTAALGYTPPTTDTTYGNATTTAAGLMSTAAQTFAGAKTFNTGVSATSFTATSSRKLKRDISSTLISALSVIKDTEIVDFKYINDTEDTPHVGFIAEDTPEILSTPSKSKMDMVNCIGVLLKAVQEITEGTKILEQRIKALEEK